MYPSPGSERGGKEDRARTARACDSCYKKKIKCDTAVPCNWCSHHDIPCTFERTFKRRRKTESQENEQQQTPGLAERISRIERFLVENLTRPSEKEEDIGESPGGATTFNTMESVTPIAQPPIPSSGMLHFAGRVLGGLSWNTGFPFLLPETRQWVESISGQTVAVDKFHPPSPPWSETSSALMMTLQTQDAFALPNRSTVHYYFDTFVASFIRFIFPVIDPILFPETIEVAYHGPQPGDRYGNASTKACIYAFLAFASVMDIEQLRSPASVNLSPHDVEMFSARAQCLLPHILQEPTSLEGVQTVTMMAWFNMLSGKLQSANYLISVVIRFVFMLGAHVAAPVSASDDRHRRVQRHLRNVFWLCYILDKDLSLRTGQPQMLSNENCDLTLPPEYVATLNSCVGPLEHVQELIQSPIFPIDLRLSIVKSRACSMLYSLHAWRKTDAELLKDIRELDEELERWRMSVPPQWRPTVSYSHEAPPDHHVNMHSLVQRLNYHLCMTIIHQASSRCRAWSMTQSRMMEGVSLSLALSVEASRSTLTYLQATEHVVVGGAFWVIVFYPLSALICIFCTILQNPLDPQATKDLSLLSSVNGMMVRMFVRRFSSAHETVHFKLMTDFVAELHRLAKCAIEKAWSENGFRPG